MESTATEEVHPVVEGQVEAVSDNIGGSWNDFFAATRNDLLPWTLVAGLYCILVPFVLLIFLGMPGWWLGFVYIGFAAYCAYKLASKSESALQGDDDSVDEQAVVLAQAKDVFSRSLLGLVVVLIALGMTIAIFTKAHFMHPFTQNPIPFVALVYVAH